MTILELFKKVDPSVLAAKMIFKHLQDIFPVLKIADIADTSSGGTPNRGMIEYYNGDIPWVKSGELKDGLITNCDEYITDAGLKNSSAKLFPKGTLLVAMYGANIGKTGVLDFDATTNQAVCAIFPKVEISKDFLFWYFKQQRIDFIAIGKGGAQPNISQTVINNASIVVPDVKTQKLIVDFLERIEQGNGIDEKFFIPEVLKDVVQIYRYKNSYVALTESFENQLTQLANLNQAILQEAVQGKLVPQNPTDEPASELLKRIKTEKAKSGKKEKPLPPIKPEEIPFEIPESWVWCRLGEITDIQRGSSPRPKGDSRYFSKSKTNYNWITISDISNFCENDILLQTREYLTKEGSKQSRYVDENEFIIAVSGSTTGKCCITGIDGFIYDGLAVAKIIKNSIDSRYLLNYMMCLYSIINNSKTGASFPNINTNYLNNLVFPLPPLSEQKRINAEVEKQLAITKQIKEHVIANQHATEQLLKALLHGAFEVKEMEEV